MPKRLMEDLQVMEVTVCRKGQNPEAKMLVWKSQDKDEQEVVLKSKFKEVLHSMVMDEVVEEAMEPMWELNAALRRSFREIMEDDSITDKIGAMKASIREYADTYQSMLDEAVQAVANKSSDSEDGYKKKKKEVTNKMGDENKTFTKEEVQKMIDDALKGQATQLDEVQEVIKMSPDEQAYYFELEEAEDRTEFAKSKPEDRKAAVKKAADMSDTIVIQGQVVSKSVAGDGLFAVLKTLSDKIDAQDKVIKDGQEAFAKATEKTELLTLAKQADAEFTCLTGSPEHKGAVLKAINDQPEEIRDALLGVLKASSFMSSSFFKSFGTDAGDEDSDTFDIHSVEKALEDLSVQVAEENGITKEQAFAEVIKSPDGRQLYNAYNQMQAEVSKEG